MEKKLEKRMYFFTIYQLTGIQSGIQCGHAALEYALQFGDTEIYQDFILHWKTWIILNGGTTNEKRDLDGIPSGSLNQIGDSLLKNKINFTYFNEPDLQDALTAVCFICDERVWNYEDYPDFIDFFARSFSGTFDSKDVLKYPSTYNDWIVLLGGPKNVFLRELINGKKLA